jgi:hypothetical protein
MGSRLRVENKSELDDFLARDDAPRLVKAASFEEVFFTVMAVGLADSLDLLPMVTGRQVRGFIDLDCWRKDQFVRKPFMEWIAAFIQSGPEDTAKALSGIDEYVLALFLKDLIHVYEVDRDDPPETTEMILTPDSRFGVEPVESGEVTTIGMLILDALFKYNPHLGTQILTLVRYTTRLELEETAYDNKIRRLEVHGFVDYYEAMSIYSGPNADDTVAKGDVAVEAIPGEETPGHLPMVFADSLSGGSFLVQALESVTDPEESERIAQGLTGARQQDSLGESRQSGRTRRCAPFARRDEGHSDDRTGVSDGRPAGTGGRYASQKLRAGNLQGGVRPDRQASNPGGRTGRYLRLSARDAGCG